MELAKRYQQRNISTKIEPPRGSDGQGHDLDADDELPQSYRQASRNNNMPKKEAIMKNSRENMAINAEIDHEYQSPVKEEGIMLKLEKQADLHT